VPPRIPSTKAISLISSERLPTSKASILRPSPTHPLLKSLPQSRATSADALAHFAYSMSHSLPLPCCHHPLVFLSPPMRILLRTRLTRLVTIFLFARKCRTLVFIHSLQHFRPRKSSHDSSVIGHMLPERCYHGTLSISSYLSAITDLYFYILNLNSFVATFIVPHILLSFRSSRRFQHRQPRIRRYLHQQ
jgi:hypothetical protein